MFFFFFAIVERLGGIPANDVIDVAYAFFLVLIYFTPSILSLYSLFALQLLLPLLAYPIQPALS
jgi:uncharacterized membrane protein